MSDEELRKCERIGCSNTFEPLAAGTKREKRFCCQKCKDSARWQRERENDDPIIEEILAEERRQELRGRKQDLKEEAKKLTLMDAVCRAQERHSGWTPKRFSVVHTTGKHNPEDANVLFGDWHNGEIVRLDETGGLGEYNTKIGQARLKLCVESQAEIIGIQRGGGVKIDHCNVWLLGDMVTGEKIFKGQTAYIDQFLVDQTISGKEMLAETLLNMLDIYKTITCRCVVGNHGRIGEKGEGPVWNNYDYLMYHMTQDYLQNYPQISWEISKSWFQTAEILGWRFIAQHGDDIRMHMRIPWYGIERDVNDMGAMLWDINELPPHYWLYAHFHQAEQAELVHGERIMNGSLVGGSQFSTKKLKRVSRPSQSFFGLSEKRGVTWRYNLYLDKESRRQSETPPAPRRQAKDK